MVNTTAPSSARAGRGGLPRGLDQQRRTQQDALLCTILEGESRKIRRWEVMMANRYSRREFLENSSLAGLAAAALGSEAGATSAMPTRVLGKTGARISILALGCG